MAAEDKTMTEEIVEEKKEESAEAPAEEAADDAGTETGEQEEAADPSADSDDGSGAEQAQKRRLFGKKDKKDKKDKQIEELNAQIADLTDRVKRTMAEFDNFRKRTEKEKAAMFDLGAKSMIEKILPVIDNFERGLAGVPEEQKADAFVDGMDKVYRQMIKNLTEAGLEQIEAVGQTFDPNLHNAVMHVENEELGENIVAAEFQKGYIYKGNVVRHSMVQVAN